LIIYFLNKIQDIHKILENLPIQRNYQVISKYITKCWALRCVSILIGRA